MKKVILGFLLLIFSTSFFFSWASEKKIVIEERIYPAVIVGGGAGAMTSSVYLSRGQVLPLVLEGKTPGGAITKSHMVENWPGEIGIPGMEIADRLKAQAEKNGAVFLEQEVVDINLSTYPYVITSKDVFDEDQIFQYKTYSILLAMGTTPNYLGIPGEEKFWGKGVSNCATCDGSFYKNKTVAIVGGGDSALVEADYLSNIASKVKIFVRKDHFKASDIALKEAVLRKGNIEVFFNSTVVEVLGDKTLNGIVVKTEGTERRVPIDGFFLAIGSTPNTSFLEGKLPLDKNGYVQLQHDQETFKRGVYAIGDVSDPVYKQLVTAAGDGTKAALQMEHYLRNLKVKDNNITILRPTDYQLINETEQIVSSDVKPIEIVSIEQFHKELKSDIPVIVDFYADWCPPCQKLMPFLNKKTGELSGAFKVLKVNKDKMPSLFDTYNIESMPTVLVFENHKEVTRKEGEDVISHFLTGLSSENAGSKAFVQNR